MKIRHVIRIPLNRHKIYPSHPFHISHFHFSATSTLLTLYFFLSINRTSHHHFSARARIALLTRLRLQKFYCMYIVRARDYIYLRVHFLASSQTCSNITFRTLMWLLITSGRRARLLRIKSACARDVCDYRYVSNVYKRELRAFCYSSDINFECVC